MAAAGARLIMLPQGSCPLSHRRKIFFQILQQLFRLAIQIQKFQPQIIPDKRICRRNIRQQSAARCGPNFCTSVCHSSGYVRLSAVPMKKRVILADLGYIPGVSRPCAVRRSLSVKNKPLKERCRIVSCSFWDFSRSAESPYSLPAICSILATAYWSGN